MTKVLVTESSLEDIADAIREKNGSSSTYKPGRMATAIRAITTGIEPTGTINITQNGTTDVTQYASANVQVPNTYVAGDEGKVVQSGALVAQTSRSVTANGTVDTTTNNSVTVSVLPNLQSKTATQNGTVTPDTGYDGLSQVSVDVPNTYTAADEGKVISNGALVGQTSRTVTANDTYDTTTNDEVVVNVQPTLQQKTVTENGVVTPDTGYDGLSQVSVNVLSVRGDTARLGSMPTPSGMPKLKISQVGPMLTNQNDYVIPTYPTGNWVGLDNTQPYEINIVFKFTQDNGWDTNNRITILGEHYDRDSEYAMLPIMYLQYDVTQQYGGHIAIKATIDMGDGTTVVGLTAPMLDTTDDLPLNNWITANVKYNSDQTYSLTVTYNGESFTDRTSIAWVPATTVARGLIFGRSDDSVGTTELGALCCQAGAYIDLGRSYVKIGSTLVWGSGT